LNHNNNKKLIRLLLSKSFSNKKHFTLKLKYLTMVSFVKKKKKNNKLLQNLSTLLEKGRFTIPQLERECSPSE